MDATHNVACDGHGVDEIALDLVEHILDGKSEIGEGGKGSGGGRTHLVGASEEDGARLGVLAVDKKSKRLITNLIH